MKFDNNNVDNSEYFTTSTFKNVVRSQVGIFFYIARKHTFVWKKFWRISFICIWIKSYGWRYCVVRNVVFCQHLSWCSGILWLSYIPCWQIWWRRLCVCERLLHIYCTQVANFSVCHAYYEFSVVRISLSNNCAVVIIGVYRPPDKSKIP